MSNVLTLKKGLMAAVCVGGLTLTACASSQTSGSRYGSVYDYESGGDCGNACGAVVTPPVSSSRYGSDTVIGGQAVSPGVVYADCSVVGGMNCGQPAPQPVPVYTQPAPTYTQPAPVYTPPAYTGPVSCPAGTTPNGDGTCMQQGGDYGYTPSTPAYSDPAPVYTAPTQSYSAPVACPAGTTPNGDGTCMEGSGYDFSSSSSSSSSSTYSSSQSGQMGDCPSGTTRANDGSCMMSENSNTNVVIYGSDNNDGYQAPTDYQAPKTYLPYRK